MGLGVIKEWLCIDHGEFECSDPICPAVGCDSSAVSREFRTAPKVRSGMMKQFDAGIRKSSDMYRINDFRTSREGEAAHGGRAKMADGTGMLWGDDCRRVLGKSFAELTGLAHKPLVVQKRDGSGELRLEENNALRAMANEPDSAGTYRRMGPRAPAAEVRLPRKETNVVVPGAPPNKSVAESMVQR